MKRNYYGQDTALLMQIHVTYEDGTSAVIGSDEAWKTSTGPILESDIYNGEIYDARLEMPGWNRTEYDDGKWHPVKVIEHDKKILVASYGPPVRKVKEIRPVDILKTPNGDTVYDMGQNMVGWVRLRVAGDAGDTVALKHAEVLDKDGNLYIENLRKAQQLVKYTLKGGEEEIYEPRFTFQGFRYVAVRGYPGELDLDSLTGIVVHSDMPPAGKFSCSNALVNQLQHNIQWGQRGNFLDVPTDCPQRNERLGWTGDAQVFGPTACFNFDAAGFFTKWLKDLAADQYDNGSVPHVIPDVLWDERPDIPNEALETRSNMPPMPDIDSGASAAWADASVIVPWTLYLCYGDTRILAQQYDSMKLWVEYIRKRAGDSYLWTGDGHYGDWLAFATNRSDYPGATTNKDLIATAYYAYSTRLLSAIAKILNKDDDSKKYAGLFEKIKNAFQSEYVSPNGRLMSDTQTAYSLALAFGLLNDEVRPKAAEYLSEDVRKFGHITTGFVGANLISQALTDNGYNDLAYMLLNRTIYPSWLYPITMGATTIWERWDGMRPDGSFQDAEMNSFNHYAYGAIGDWLYRVVAGIGIDPERPGYKHIIIHPMPGGELTSAAASHRSMYGVIESSWKIENGVFQLTISIPPNTTATICLEDISVGDVRESGKLLKDSFGISEFEQEDGLLKIVVGSGVYQFEYRE
jgi:alpha-L-rhamnosidase